MGDKSSKTEMATLKDWIGDIEFAMLTTVESGGTLRSRPMTVRFNEEEDDLWFFTSLESSKVDEVERDRHVNVAFAAPAENRFVSVSGLASIVRDRDRIDEFWSPGYKAWFPRGKDEPDLALLRVKITHAETWDKATGRMVRLTGILPPGKQGRPGEYRQLSFDEDGGRTSAYAHDKGESRVDPQTRILSPLDESPD